MVFLEFSNFPKVGFQPKPVLSQAVDRRVYFLKFFGFIIQKTEAIKKKLPQPEPTPQPKKVEKTKQVPVAAWDSESDEEVSPQPAKQVEKKATPAEGKIYF